MPMGEYMNKKVLALALAGSLAAGAANAFDNKFYLGAAVEWNAPKYKDVDTNLGSSTSGRSNLGGGLMAGLQLHEHFGAEVGYNYIKKNTSHNGRGNKITTKVKNFYVDALGVYEISPEVDLIGSIGLGDMKPTVEIANETINNNGVNDSQFNFRIGFGAHYKFDENLVGRFKFTNQKGNSDFIRSNTSLSFGLLWYF